MKLKLITLLFALSNMLCAQTFTEAPQSPALNGVIKSAVAFADVDGDNDLDLLITGAGSGIGTVSTLYINDGQGNYSEMTDTPFEGVKLSAIAFADIDGDDDQDVLITGENSSLDRTAKLYTNDGQGNFSAMTSMPFAGVLSGSVAFADIDGDNDQDVLITGTRIPALGISSILYRNDGQGNFNDVNNAPFDAVRSGSVAFADVDGDNDQDVLITGENNDFDRVSKLYLNDGSGNFSEMANTPFDGVYSGAIAFADVDGDNDQDVLISGENDSFMAISKLYLNDGSGNFSEMTNTPFEPIRFAAIAFADVNGDNAPDVLISGNSLEGVLSKLYLNDGQGNFSELTNMPFDEVSFGSVAFADINGDDAQDILITGSGMDDEISKLYLNDGITSTATLLPIDLDIQVIPYPNPTRSSTLNLIINSPTSHVLNLKVYSMTGQLFVQQREFVRVGQQTIVLNTASLSAGTYLIQIDNGRKRKVSNFVVE